MENTVSDTDALLWRVATLREQIDLHYKNIAFWVDLLLPWVNLFLPRAICFCREWFAFAMSELLLPWKLNTFRECTCKHESKRKSCKSSERRFDNLSFQKTYKLKPTSRKSAKFSKCFWCLNNFDIRLPLIIIGHKLWLSL